MKCPKCGYNSFEIHDTCKKCANDLTSYKDIHGLKSMVLPLGIRTSMAEKMMAEKMPEDQAVVEDTPADMFSFDIPDSESVTDSNSFPKEDPFDFGDESQSTISGGSELSFGSEQISAQAKAEEDAFADLLESSSQDSGSTPPPAQPSGAGSQDGLELNNFSWDDTPDPTPGEVAKPVEDDFNSLFGDTDDTAKK